MAATTAARDCKCCCRKLLSCGAGGTFAGTWGTQGTLAAKVEKIRQHLLLLECTVRKNFADWQKEDDAAEDQEIRLRTKRERIEEI